MALNISDFSAWREPRKRSIPILRDLANQQDILVSQEDLHSGTWIVGVQGSGKTSILTQIGLEQMRLGESVIVLDPTGDMIHDLIARMPEHRVKDAHYLSLKEFQFPFSLNLFSYPNPGSVGFEAKNAARNQIYLAFNKIFPETGGGVYFKGILRNLIPILLDHPTFTIFNIESFLVDLQDQKRVLSEIDNPRVVSFWQRFQRLPDKDRYLEAGPFLRRLEEILDDPVIANHIGQKKGLVDIRKAILNREILFIHLPLDEMAYRNAAPIIGTLVMMQIYAATFSFASMERDKRPGFTLLVDEFSKWVYESGDEFTDLFAFGRKYGIKQVLCQQYTGQFDEEKLQSIKEGVTSAHTIISLRTNLADSPRLAPLFHGLTKKPTDIYINVLDNLGNPQNPPLLKEFYLHTVRPLQVASRMVPDRYTGEILTYDFGFGAVPFDPALIPPILDSLNSLLYYAQKDRSIPGDLKWGFLDKYKRLTRITWVEIEEDPAIKKQMEQIDEDLDGVESWKKRIEEKQRRERREAIDPIDKRSDEVWKLHYAQYEKLMAFTRAVDYEHPGWEQKEPYIPIIEANLKRLEEEKEQLRKQWSVVWEAVSDSYREVEHTIYDKDKALWKQRNNLEKSLMREVTYGTDQLLDFDLNLVYVMMQLIAEPLTEDKPELASQEIADMLKGLEERKGLAKIEGSVYQVKTLELPSPCGDEVKSRRWGSIIAHTKEKYCRGRKELENEIAAAYQIDEPAQEKPKEPEKRLLEIEPQENLVDESKLQIFTTMFPLTNGLVDQDYTEFFQLYEEARNDGSLEDEKVRAWFDSTLVFLRQEMTEQCHKVPPPRKERPPFIAPIDTNIVDVDKSQQPPPALKQTKPDRIDRYENLDDF